jgi:hypothetical protein
MNTFKGIIIFVVTFAVVALGDMAIFSGFLSPILTQGDALILNNTGLSFLMFFWLFIGIPALAAYFMAFSLFKEKKIAKDTAKGQLKTGLILTLIMGVLATAFILWMGKPRFAPYTFYDIQPGELSQPVPTNFEIESNPQSDSISP